MTIQEFIAALTQLHVQHPELTWRLSDAGSTPDCLRTTITSRPLCPITAVYWARTGILISPACYADCSKTLGLTRDDARAIAYAADLTNAPEHRDVRTQLLTACGLSAEAV